MLTHVLRSQQFDRPLLERLFAVANDLSVDFHGYKRAYLKHLLAGRMLYTLFYEPSTRTRISFESAGSHLGMHVVTSENAKDFSSAMKGESLEDTIRVLSEYYPDVIVLRHYESGAAERAAKVAYDGVSIINAGDGGEQHPTQALLDLYTIMREKGRLHDLVVCMGGDLNHGRTVRSLSYLLSKFERIRLVFVAPAHLSMRGDILSHLDEHHVPYDIEHDVKRAVQNADVIYWTRIQKERMLGVAICPDTSRPWEPDPEYHITKEVLSLARDDAVIMHPLPRLEEIGTEIDDDRRAAYFRQAGNGMFIRMALLYLLCEHKA